MVTVQNFKVISYTFYVMGHCSSVNYAH